LAENNCNPVWQGVTTTLFDREQIMITIFDRE